MVTWLIALALSFPALSAEPGPAPSPSAAPADRDFHDDVERDFSIRSIGQLQITNMRGNVSLQGWTLDKIRVLARRKVRAASSEQARKFFSALDFRYREVEGDIELSAEYGKGLSLEERLREREHPQAEMEMQVFAPSNFKVRVWAVDGKVSVKTWNSHVDVRAHSGSVSAEGIRNGTLAVFCPECSIQVKAVKGSVRCIGGSGAIDVSDINGSQVYLESAAGPIRAQHVAGEQLYVTKSGDVTGADLNGHIEFHTLQGAVDITNATGFLSGRTDSGSVKAKMKEWVFRDKALIETVKGNVLLTLPSVFSGDVDLWSPGGRVSVAFPIQPTAETRGHPIEPNHPVGRVGDGGELLKIFSEKGDIDVRRGD